MIVILNHIIINFLHQRKINKWFSTTLTTNMVYDDHIKIVQKDGSKGSRLQFKEVLGVGVQFNF